MNELLNKSKLNNDAAGLLISNKNYAPSVHCSYYSFIQTAIYILANFGYSVQNKNSSHEDIRNQLFYLLSKRNRFDSVKFQTDFNQIKKMRIRSDYLDLEISEKIANDVKNTSEKLTTLVRKLQDYGSTR